MKKPCLLIMISSVLFLNGCKQYGDKTEIKVQLSEIEYFYSMAFNRDDSSFIAAYDYAQKNYNPETGGFLSVFETKWSEICPDCTLAALFGSIELRDKINFESTNQEVITVLNEEIKLAMEKTIQVLVKRIEVVCKPASFLAGLFDKTEVSVKELPAKHTWSFTVNRKVNSAHITKLLEAKTEIGFWETYMLTEIWDYLAQADALLKESSVVEELNIKPDSSDAGGENLLFRFLLPMIDAEGRVMDDCIIGIAHFKDTALVNKLFSMTIVQHALPRNLKLVWSSKPYKWVEDYYSLVAVKVTNMDGRPLLTGEHIVEASVNEKGYFPVLKIVMNAEGARLWARITRNNIGLNIAIVINDAVWSHPRVSTEITGGDSEISGDFTEEEAADIAILLGSGAMPKIGVKVIEIK